ncbi:MAG: hypothetical protein PHV02_16335 [Rhodocyclaceae bacterium]|nr:hypothetical protein [Rhodocyclaceae bacterium]
MRKQNEMMKRFAKLATLLMLGASMSAYAGFLGLGGNSWKEEVLLHDGSKIIVKRSQSYGGSHEIGQALPIKEHTISFTLPNSNKSISWVSEYGDDIGRTNFNLLAVHVLNGTPYVVASPNLCLSYNKWGRPNPPYVFFRYDGKDWQRIPLSEFPEEFQTVNLDFGMTWAIRDRKVRFDRGDLLLAETVRLHNEKSRDAVYRTILREYAPGAGGPGAGCGEMIRINDGWEGTGFFSGQPSKEACLKYCERKEVSAQDCPCNRFFRGE